MLMINGNKLGAGWSACRFALQRETSSKQTQCFKCTLQSLPVYTAVFLYTISNVSWCMPQRCSAAQDTKRQLVSRPPPMEVPPGLSAAMEAEYNASQMTAVRSGLDGSDVLLIQGPPGEDALRSLFMLRLLCGFIPLLDDA